MRRFLLVSAGLLCLSYSPTVAATEPPPQFITMWELTDAEGIAVDAAGYVYVTSYDDRVSKFTDSGQFVLSWGESGPDPGQFLGSFGIAVDAAGRIFVSNYDSEQEREADIEVFTSEGEFISQFGPPGTDPGQLVTPVGVAVSPLGTVYVASYGGVVKYDHNGSFVGTVNVALPWGVAVDAAGNLFVSDIGNMAIHKFDPAGNLLLSFGGQGTEPGLFRWPNGIAVDGAGNIYVADYGNFRVQKFSPSGSLLSYWGTNGDGPGQFSTPSGVAIGPDGSIYVCDYHGHHVQKFGYGPTPVQGVTWGALKSRYRGEVGDTKPPSK